MGLFGNNKEDEVQVTEQEKVVSELDKLENYIKNKNWKDSNVYQPILVIIKTNYIEGISNYKRCIEFINFCFEYQDKLKYDFTSNSLTIYELFMSFENTLRIKSILMLGLKKHAISIYIDYIMNSRAYFSDNETWYARIYEVINNDINLLEALTEDKMRLGIYPNIKNEEIDRLNKKLDNLKIHIGSNKKELNEIEEKTSKINNEITKNIKDKEERIDATFKSSISEIQRFTDDSIDKIKNFLNINPSSKKEILKELEKQYDVIDAFDESVDIKERYEKLISLKNSTIIYHPKFNEVLKYYLAGNTVCLSGPNKCGKTNLAKQLADLLKLSFNNLGNIYNEATQINGYYDFNTNYNKPTFQNCFENGGVVLIKNIDNAPIEAISSLNNIISNFSYNPYIFGDKLLTTPNKNFRLIMTNNNGYKIDRANIDNLITINLDYDTNYENSLTNDKNLLEFLHELRRLGLNITTDTFKNIITHLNLGLLSIEEVLNNYILTNNNLDLINRTLENVNKDNKYNITLKKLIKG